MKKNPAIVLLLVAALAAWLRLPAEAVPIQCEGSLTDAGGRPLEGAFLLNFRLWKADGLGEAQWRSSRYVSAKGGKFAVTLGDKEDIPAAAVERGFKLTIDPPPGTGWSAQVLGNRLAGARTKTVRKAARPSRSSAAAATAAGHLAAGAQAPGRGAPVEDSARGFYVRPSAPKAVRKAAAAPSGEFERIQRDLAQTRADALRAKREAEESRKRIEALEAEVKRANSRPSESSVNIYVVRSGDTLRSIASKLYHDPDRWMDLYQANHDRLQRGGELIPGQKLVVPGG